MNKINSHEDLIIWQKSVLLVKLAYGLTRKFPDNEKFGLTVQMQRASISIMSNIAEGAGRNSKNEFRHFLSISQGSLSELDSQFYIAKELGYLSDIEKAKNLIIPLRIMISNLIKKLK